MNNYEQGLGFSENSGYWPMPIASTGVIKIIDDDDQPHCLVMDYREGIFYDITTRDGPSGSNLVKYFKDKVDVDGTGGQSIPTEIHFKEDTGEVERYVVEHNSSRFYVRPADGKDRRYQDEFSPYTGYLGNTEFTTEVYVDGAISSETAKSINIPNTGEIVYDKKVEGNRLQTVFKSNESGYSFVGRHQEYIAKDINQTPDQRVLNEGLCQEKLSNTLLGWLTRDNPTYDRISKEYLSTNGYTDNTFGTPATITVSEADGPNSESNWSAGISGGYAKLFTLPEITSTKKILFTAWIYPNDSLSLTDLVVAKDDIGVSLPLVDTTYTLAGYGYKLYYGLWNVPSSVSESDLMINVTSGLNLFDVRLIETTSAFYGGTDTVTISDVTEYAYRDGYNNSFDNICPMV